MSDEYTKALVAIQDQLQSMSAKMDRLLLQTGPKRPSEDGQVYKDPNEKHWTGESYAGCKFSECPPDYLRAFAKYKGACVWAAQKKHKETGNADELKYVSKNEGEAKLAIAWAEFREVSGPASETKAAPTGKRAQGSLPVGDDDVPFSQAV